MLGLGLKLGLGLGQRLETGFCLRVGLGLRRFGDTIVCGVRESVRHKFRVGARHPVRVSDRFRDNLRLSVTERIRVRIQTVPG